MARLPSGVIPGLIAGLLAAAGAIYISYTQLKAPQIPLDWAALVATGLTTGIILFFIVWGHFQKDPDPTKNP